MILQKNISHLGQRVGCLRIRADQRMQINSTLVYAFLSSVFFYNKSTFGSSSCCSEQGLKNRARFRGISTSRSTQKRRRGRFWQYRCLGVQEEVDARVTTQFCRNGGRKTKKAMQYQCSIIFVLLFPAAPGSNNDMTNFDILMFLIAKSNGFIGSQKVRYHN